MLSGHCRVTISWHSKHCRCGTRVLFLQGCTHYRVGCPTLHILHPLSCDQICYYKCCSFARYTGNFHTVQTADVLLIGPSGVRALPFAAGRNEGGHYFGPSGVRALPLAAGTNEGGHYFRYILVRAALCRRCVTAVGHYFR